MNIIVHYPESEEAKQELAKRVAIVHAQAIISRVKSLSCPLTQEIALLDVVIEKIKENEL